MSSERPGSLSEKTLIAVADDGVGVDTLANHTGDLGGLGVSHRGDIQTHERSFQALACAHYRTNLSLCHVSGVSLWRPLRRRRAMTLRLRLLAKKPCRRERRLLLG